VRKIKHEENGLETDQHGGLSKREGQIMEILYRKKSASVEDIRAEIPNPPGYSAVRVIVNVLERKGHIRHITQGKKYIYTPTVPRKKAEQRALKNLLHTYFENSLHRAVTAMLELHKGDLNGDDIEKLARAIEKVKKEDSS
jgi:BlaI family transcriptional regulator, penicillinase repressor